jgi:UDP-GlcNAc:undecaprenyl-phosphate/decaprenyl-phosphate GlcNAc-1-phosphate transferase
MLISGSLLLSFVVTYISIPTIVKISHFKKLFDVPNDRTSHLNEVPVLGGLSIFSGFTLSAVICTLPVESADIKFILGGMIVLFFLGLKDDILIVDPRKKLAGQIGAALIIVVLGNIRVTGFHSIMGIDELSFIPSVLFSVFLVLTLVNGFNLIDGVDGLASGVGIFTSLVTGIWFFLTGHFTYAILSFSLLGTLIAYFRFNVFGRENKIFMGDTGSMIIGFIIAILIIQFLEFDNNAPERYRFVSAPALAIGLLIIPLFDTLRVIILRLINGKSPFKADKNHIHHNLLRLGFSHIKATALLISANILLISFAVIFRGMGDMILISLLFFFAFILSLVPSILLKKREKTFPS